MGDHLSEELASILIDRYEGWELVERLDIPVAEIVAAFEDTILENIQFLKEELQYGEDEDE